MRRVIVTMSVLVIAAFAAGDLQATQWAIEADNYYNASAVFPQIPNDSNNNYYFTAPTGLTATVDGAVWLKTGSATPVLNTQNFDVSVYYKNSNGATGGWTFYETESVTDGGYAGYFLGDTNYITDSNLDIVSHETIPTLDLDMNLVTWAQGQFYLQMWTDNSQAGGGAVRTLLMLRHRLPVRPTCRASTWRRRCRFWSILDPVECRQSTMSTN